MVWKHLNLPDPTWVQYDIAEYLQHGPKRMEIEGFRGVGKSWITSAFVCWCGLRDPQVKILVVSASKTRADDFTTFTLRLIKEIPILRHLKPKSDQRESKIAFDFGPSDAAHAPSVKSAGILGQLAGSRGNLIIADDVEIPNNSATADMREKLLKAVSEFEAILVPEGEPRIIFLGTPQTEESIYNKMREKGYECRIWPARYPDEKTRQGYAGALAPKLAEKLDSGEVKAGDPTDPQRFNAQELIEREASYGRSGFALQFMLDTTLSDREKYPLKHGDLVVMDLNHKQAPVTVQYGSSPDLAIPELPTVGFSGDRFYRPMHYDKDTWADYEGSVMAIDPSGRGKDELGYSIVNQLHGNLWLLRNVGLKGGYDEMNLKRIAIDAKHFGVKRILIESNFGDGMFAQLLKPVLSRIYPVTTEDVHHHTQKEARIIDTLEPILNQHRLIVDRGVIQNDIKFLQQNPEQNQRYSLLYQLTRLTRERGALKHDDRLDSLAMAVAYWIDAMSRDEKIAVKAHTDKMLEKELRTHMEHLLSGKMTFGQDRMINTGNRLV